MSGKRNQRFIVFVALAAVGFAQADQNIASNGSMESGGGSAGPNERVPADWTLFGPSVERSDEAALSGSWSFKAFGSDPTVGAFQDVAIAAGQTASISAELFTRGADRIAGDAEAKIKIEFLDAGETILSSVEITVLDVGSTADVWTPASIGPEVAPAGSVTVRMTCVWTYTTTSLGSAYWDDCVLSIDAGPDALSNGDFETPGVDTGPNPFGIDDWTGFGEQQKSGDQAFHGASSARIEVGTTVGSFAGLFQDTRDLEAGDRLFAQCYVYNPSGTGLSGAAAAAMKIEFFPTAGTELPPPEEHLVFDANSPVDSWELVSYVTTVPADITLARIVLLSDDTSGVNGPVYLDSASVERSSQPGVNQLTNESFESGTSGANGLTDWTEFRGFLCQARKNAFEVAGHDGLSVLKISGECVAGIYQDVAVAAGETLTISTFVQSTSADPYADPASRAGVKVEWIGGVVPPQIDINGAPNNTLGAGAPQDLWTPIWIDFTMPAGSAALVRCTVILARGDVAGAEVFFDGFEAVVRNFFDGADSDADDDEDLLDFANLQRTFAGPGVSVDQWNGMVFDTDEDDDIDLDDWGFFWPRFTGPALEP